MMNDCTKAILAIAKHRPLMEREIKYLLRWTLEEAEGALSVGAGLSEKCLTEAEIRGECYAALLKVRVALGKVKDAD